MEDVKFSEKIEDILKGGPGSGIKGHRTSKDKRDFVSSELKRIFGKVGDTSGSSSSMDNYVLKLPTMKNQDPKIRSLMELKKIKGVHVFQFSSGGNTTYTVEVYPGSFDPKQDAKEATTKKLVSEKTKKRNELNFEILKQTLSGHGRIDYSSMNRKDNGTATGQVVIQTGDRGPRTDMEDDEAVNRAYDEYKKKYASKMESLEKQLKKQGFKDAKVDFDYGEKGHIGIEIVAGI